MITQRKEEKIISVCISLRNQGLLKRSSSCLENINAISSVKKSHDSIDGMMVTSDDIIHLNSITNQNVILNSHNMNGGASKRMPKDIL